MLTDLQAAINQNSVLLNQQPAYLRQMQQYQTQYSTLVANGLRGKVRTYVRVRGESLLCSPCCRSLNEQAMMNQINPAIAQAQQAPGFPPAGMMGFPGMPTAAVGGFPGMPGYGGSC